MVFICSGLLFCRSIRLTIAQWKTSQRSGSILPLFLPISSTPVFSRVVDSEEAILARFPTYFQRRADVLNLSCLNGLSKRALPLPTDATEELQQLRSPSLPFGPEETMEVVVAKIMHGFGDVATPHPDAVRRVHQCMAEWWSAMNPVQFATVESIQPMVESWYPLEAEWTKALLIMSKVSTKTSKQAAAHDFASDSDDDDVEWEEAIPHTDAPGWFVEPLSVCIGPTADRLKRLDMVSSALDDVQYAVFEKARKEIFMRRGRPALEWRVWITSLGFTCFGASTLTAKHRETLIWMSVLTFGRIGLIMDVALALRAFRDPSRLTPVSSNEILVGAEVVERLASCRCLSGCPLLRLQRTSALGVLSPVEKMFCNISDAFSNVQVPVEASVEVPVDVPSEVQEKVPVDVPVEVPVEVPMEVPLDVSVDVPMEVPVEVPIDVETNAPKCMTEVERRLEDEIALLKAKLAEQHEWQVNIQRKRLSAIRRWQNEKKKALELQRQVDDLSQQYTSLAEQHRSFKENHKRKWDKLQSTVLQLSGSPM